MYSQLRTKKVKYQCVLTKQNNLIIPISPTANCLSNGNGFVFEMQPVSSFNEVMRLFSILLPPKGPLVIPVTTVTCRLGKAKKDNNFFQNFL